MLSCTSLSFFLYSSPGDNWQCTTERGGGLSMQSTSLLLAKKKCRLLLNKWILNNAMPPDASREISSKIFSLSLFSIIFWVNDSKYTESLDRNLCDSYSLYHRFFAAWSCLRQTSREAWDIRYYCCGRDESQQGEENSMENSITTFKVGISSSMRRRVVGFLFSVKSRQLSATRSSSRLKSSHPPPPRRARTHCIVRDCVRLMCLAAALLPSELNERTIVARILLSQNYIFCVVSAIGWGWYACCVGEKMKHILSSSSWSRRAVGESREYFYTDAEGLGLECLAAFWGSFERRPKTFFTCLFTSMHDLFFRFHTQPRRVCLSLSCNRFSFFFCVADTTNV